MVNPVDPEDQKSHQILQDLLQKSRKAGADAADALLVDSEALGVSLRLGKIESLEHSSSIDLGLRVFIGRKQAIVSTSDRRQQTLTQLVERAISMARAAPEDPFCGVAEENEVAQSWPALETADENELTTETLLLNARAAEERALAVDGVTNSEGVETSRSRTEITLASSNGFQGRYVRTSYGLSASVLAGQGTAMERDYDYASRVYYKDLPSPEDIGRSAGERAVKRLGARKMPTASRPVVYDPRVAGSLLAQLAGAISGASVARGTSFLKDKLGKSIFSKGVNIVDDPFRSRGLRSRPFDAEGFLPKKRYIIEGGVLTTWLLDLRSSRQLGLQSTGHAVRSSGGVPSPSASNFYLEPGNLSPKELISDIKDGFYVTELMGMGVNGVTGDYSQAASGFWIENGTIVFPVSEMTIAGNLKNMFSVLVPANDLEFTRGIDSPTVRIENMTVAGR